MEVLVGLLAEADANQEITERLTLAVQFARSASELAAVRGDGAARCKRGNESIAFDKSTVWFRCPEKSSRAIQTAIEDGEFASMDLKVVSGQPSSPSQQAARAHHRQITGTSRDDFKAGDQTSV